MILLPPIKITDISLDDLYKKAKIMLNVIILGHYAFCSGEGNGTPLQYSCLENPMDRGAW